MFEQFREKFALGADKWNDYISCLKCIEVPAETVLLNEDETSKKMFLIEKGCVCVIAAYLGVTKVHLSHIKSKLLKEK